MRTVCVLYVLVVGFLNAGISLQQDNAKLIKNIVDNADNFDSNIIVVKQKEDKVVAKNLPKITITKKSVDFTKNTKRSNASEYLATGKNRMFVFVSGGVGSSYLFSSWLRLTRMYGIGTNGNIWAKDLDRSIPVKNGISPVINLKCGIEYRFSKSASWALIAGFQKMHNHLKMRSVEKIIGEITLIGDFIGEVKSIYTDGASVAKFEDIFDIGVKYKTYIDENRFFAVGAGVSFGKLRYAATKVPTIPVLKNTFLHGGHVSVSIGNKINDQCALSLDFNYRHFLKSKHPKIASVNLFDVVVCCTLYPGNRH